MNDDILRVAEKLGLEIEAEFVPWPRSRSSAERTPSLNWRVTILKDGRRVLTTDYTAGYAHCPSYDPHRRTVDGSKAVKLECETGYRTTWIGGLPHSDRRKPIPIDEGDFLASVAWDAQAVDYARFEDWCADVGGDPDSRREEAVYRACLENGLALRAAVGDDGLKELQRAAWDR